MPDYFAHLESDFDGGGGRLPARQEAPTYPCESCGGSGRWSGGRNQRGESKCFACNGRGHFKQSAGDRFKAREQRRSRKQANLDDARETFVGANPGLVETLNSMIEWNSFAASLVSQFQLRGSLSTSQINAAHRMIAKVDATRAKRTQEAENAPVVDLAAIRQMFDKARESGLRRPTYRAEGLVISRAPDHGKNAGHLYIKSGDDYQGKIAPDGRFIAAYSAVPETRAALDAIAANPLEAAVRYGRMTGSCSCCGRELTNKASVEAGIGPICATKYGF